MAQALERQPNRGTTKYTKYTKGRQEKYARFLAANAVAGWQRREELWAGAAMVSIDFPERREDCRCSFVILSAHPIMVFGCGGNGGYRAQRAGCR
jgi:hypothetical protein